MMIRDPHWCNALRHVPGELILIPSTLHGGFELHVVTKPNALGFPEETSQVSEMIQFCPGCGKGYQELGGY